MSYNIIYEKNKRNKKNPLVGEGQNNKPSLVPPMD